MPDRSIRISDTLNQQIDLLRFFGIRDGKVVSGNDVIIMAVTEYFQRAYEKVKDDPDVCDWIKKRMLELMQA